MGRPAVSPFVETDPQVYRRDEFAELEARRRALVFGFVCALISVMLSIGAIASLVLAFG